MKIGIICYPTYGGSGVVATELGLELAKRGHQVHFISYAVPRRFGNYQENVFYHAVETPHYPLFEFNEYTLALAGKIIDVIKYENLDILHVHYAIPHAVSGLLAKQIIQKESNIKLVTTLHGTDITLVGMEPSFLPIVKYALEQSDSITAVSEYLRNKTIQHFNPGKDISIIPNFIDTNIYKRNDCLKLKKQIAPDNEKIVIHISNFRPVKRVTDVIKVFAEILAYHPAKLILVGDGPDRKEAELLARELNICCSIKFLGQQTEFVDLLSISDLFLLPSQSESFGLAALEALSCGVPVIASNIGGIPEVVSHGESGFLAEFADTSRMAQYANDLLSNEKKWRIFSENARTRAIKFFDSNSIIPKYINVYDIALSK